MHKRIVSFLALCAILINSLFPYWLVGSRNAGALSEEFLDMFAQNDIMFYDPDACQQCAVSCVATDGKDITVIGDSILADPLTKEKLMAKLPGIEEDQYDADPSRFWDHDVNMNGHTVVNGLQIAREMGTKIKGTLIFNLGTNASGTADNINELLGIIGTTRKLILVTPYHGNPTTQSNTYVPIGELYKETAKNNPQITIFDWADVASTSGFTFPGDSLQVHPQTDEERQAYVDGLAGAVSGSCGGGEAVVSGSTPEEKYWSGFKSLGYPDEAVAGIMGNLAHEGNFSPTQWEVGKEERWGMTLMEVYEYGKSGGTVNWGFGSPGWTWYTYYYAMHTFYMERAPDLLHYLQEPFTYSKDPDGSAYCGGTCLLKIIDENTYDRLASMEITFFDKIIKGEAPQEDAYPVPGHFEGISEQSTPETAASWWETNFEKHAGSAQPARLTSAREFYDQFHGKTSFGAGTTGGTSGANCGGAKAATAFKKYNFTDGQLRGIIAMAKNENGGSLNALKTEISVMANLYEKNGNKGSDTDEDAFIKYVRTGGWFASSTGAAYNENASVSDEEFEAAKDILNNGNRTLPPQILEHDCFASQCGAGITEASNNGVSFEPTDKSKYQKGVTKLKNNLGSTYIFWTWADPDTNGGDPFGYFEDNPPDESFSPETTRAASSSKELVNIEWSSDGWITGGMDGYVKGTPEMAGLNVTDSAPTLEFETTRPIDGKAGPNKITLHSTEGTNSVGQYGLDIYTGNPYPPHFTIDMKEKKVYQHFTVDKPSAALATVDTTGGVQIEIIGFSTTDRASSPWYLHSTDNFGDDEWLYLAKLLVGISAYTGIKLESTLDWEDRENVRMSSADEFKNYTGVLGHMHAYANDHIDPGNVWPILSKAIAKVDSGSMTNSSCGETNNAWTGDFPWWGQCDEPWNSVQYGSCGAGSDVCSSGCGCVSFAMMATALTGQLHDPKEVCTYAGEQGMHVCGAGSSHSLPQTISDHFGLQHEDMGHPTIDQINAKLRDGWMIWTCGSGPDPFTSGGHCIGVRGITGDKWLLADSKGNGEEVTLQKQWDPSSVYPNMNTFQAIRKK